MSYKIIQQARDHFESRIVDIYDHMPREKVLARKETGEYEMEDIDIKWLWYREGWSDSIDMSQPEECPKCEGSGIWNLQCCPHCEAGGQRFGKG